MTLNFENYELDGAAKEWLAHSHIRWKRWALLRTVLTLGMAAIFWHLSPEGIWAAFNAAMVVVWSTSAVSMWQRCAFLKSVIHGRGILVRGVHFGPAGQSERLFFLLRPTTSDGVWKAVTTDGIPWWNLAMRVFPPQGQGVTAKDALLDVLR
jgi:hypothetical protein